MKKKDVTVKDTEQPIDTSTSGGKAVVQMLQIFAEFETNLRKERQMEGIAKAKAALNAGGFRWDGAIGGVGGCPMAQDDLVGNAPTEKLVEWAQQEGHFSLASERAFDQAQSLAADLFG